MQVFFYCLYFLSMCEEKRFFYAESSVFVYRFYNVTASTKKESMHYNS